MNSKIIEQFNLLLKQIKAEYLNARVENQPKEMMMHSFRLKSIQKVTGILKKLDFEITDASDLKGIPGIGEGTRRRIQEILDTGTLAEIKNKYDKKKQQKIDAIQELEQVIGIGSAVAKKMVVKENIRSINDLKKAIKTGKLKVPDAIMLGLKYYGIVEGNIPRKEITDTEKYLAKEAHKIDSELEIMVCGSYRREKTTSGDIDVLVYHPKVKTMKHINNPEQVKLEPYLELFVDHLTDNGFLLDQFTYTSMKYMGFCKFKKYPVRRIDIRFIPYNSLATAMLYFTGPYELNTIMRTAAKKRGMILNEYGLYKIDDEGARTSVKIKSEKDVFNILGMDYMTPQQRETFSSGKINKTKI